MTIKSVCSCHSNREKLSEWQKGRGKTGKKMKMVDICTVKQRFRTEQYISDAQCMDVLDVFLANAHNQWLPASFVIQAEV